MADRWLTLAWVAIGCLVIWAILERSVYRARLRRDVRHAKGSAQRRRIANAGVVVPQARDRGSRALPTVLSQLRGTRPGLPDTDTLALMALEVSSRLQSGMDVAGAWEKSWKRLSRTDFLGIASTGEPLNLRPDHRRWRWRTDKIATAGASALVSACRFSFLSGAPIAEVLQQVAEGISSSARARREQERAFIGPQLSARILTVLPLLALAGGELIGAHSLSWFMGGGLGSAVAIGGMLLVVMGHGTSRRMILAAKQRAADQMEATILCDLAQAGLRSGASIPSVLSALSSSNGEPELRRVAKELLMGASWDDAWQPLPPRSDLLAMGLQPGWEQGVSPILLLSHAAEQARQRQLATAEEEAGKLAVKLVVPLGLFLLPAFIAWGVVPVIFALLSSGLGL